MADLENKIYDKILTNLSLDKLVDAILKTLLEDEQFYIKIKDRLLSEGYEGSLVLRVTRLVERRLADVFIQEHGQNILKGLDLKAITNGIAFQVIHKFTKETGG